MEMSNERIVALVQRSDNKIKYYELLYKKNYGLICKIAHKYSMQADIDDLIQEAYFALVAAAENYRETAGAFSTYFSKVLIRHINRYRYKSAGIHIPEAEQANTERFIMSVDKYISEYGKEPTAAEMAVITGMPIKRIRELQKYAAMRKVTSLDVKTGEEGTNGLIDLLPGDTDMEEREVYNLYMEHVNNALWAAVDALPGNEGDIIRHQYKNGLDSFEICDRLHLSADEFRKGQRSAIRHLRKVGNKKGILREYADEYIYNAGIRNYNFHTTWTSSTEHVAIKRLEQAGY